MTQKSKNHHEDYDDDRKGFGRKPRHSKNEKGKGMKVINSYVEEYEDFDIYDDDDYTNIHKTY